MQDSVGMLSFLLLMVAQVSAVIAAHNVREDAAPKASRGPAPPRRVRLRRAVALAARDLGGERFEAMRAEAPELVEPGVDLAQRA